MVFRKNVVVPVDFTAKNRSALRAARELARSGARLTLLHVIEPIEHVPAAELKGFYRTLERKARIRLRVLAAALRNGAVGQELVYGRRAEAIVQFATERRCDLIILSSHRVARRKQARGWATISHRVAISSQCPVLLVK